MHFRHQSLSCARLHRRFLPLLAAFGLTITFATNLAAEEALAKSSTPPASNDAPPVLEASAPEMVGFSSKRLKRLSESMQGYIDRKEVSGVVTLIARRGKVVHFEAQGHADHEAKKPMTTDTIFRIASMTKPITSVALMMLWEEGHFQLRDPVSRFLPEFADPQIAVPPAADEYLGVPYKRVQAAGEITIQHLLTHTSGLANSYRGLTKPDYTRIMSDRKPDGTIADDLEALTKLPLNFNPGTEWQYGPSTNAVGRLVEVISGLTLGEFFEQRIFGPLGNDRHALFPSRVQAATIFCAVSARRGRHDRTQGGADS